MIGLVLFPSRRLFVCRMRQGIETEACVSSVFSNWALEILVEEAVTR